MTASTDYTWLQGLLLGPQGPQGAPGSGGAGSPLASCLWVYSGAAEGGDGSYGAPFATVQDAVDAIDTFGTVLIAPGDYSTQDVAITDKEINLVGLGGPVRYLAFSRPQVSLGNVTTTTNGEGDKPTVYLSGVACASLTVVGFADLVNVQPGTADFSAANRLNVDVLTLRNCRGATPPSGGFDCPGNRLGRTFTVGVLSASMTDVTVTGIFGAEPGDMAEIVMTTQLAGVGCLGAWVSASNEVTARFFGTTAGGDIVANVATFPVG